MEAWGKRQKKKIISSLNSVEPLFSYHPCPSIARWVQECASLTHSNPVLRCRGSQKPGNCLWVCLCVFLFGFVGVIVSLSFCVWDTVCVWEYYGTLDHVALSICIWITNTKYSPFLFMSHSQNAFFRKHLSKWSWNEDKKQ